METNRSTKNAEAQKRVKELKGFYIHLIIYIFINLMILAAKIIGNHYYGDSFMGPVWHFSTFATPIFWGVGLVFHAIKVFQVNPFFSKEWESRQIQKYLEEDQKEVEKYKQRNGGNGK